MAKPDLNHYCCTGHVAQNHGPKLYNAEIKTGFFTQPQKGTCAGERDKSEKSFGIMLIISNLTSHCTNRILDICNLVKISGVVQFAHKVE